MPFDPLANEPEYYQRKLTPFQLQHDYGYGVGKGPYGNGMATPSVNTPPSQEGNKTLGVPSEQGTNWAGFGSTSPGPKIQSTDPNQNVQPNSQQINWTTNPNGVSQPLDSSTSPVVAAAPASVAAPVTHNSVAPSAGMPAVGSAPAPATNTNHSQTMDWANTRAGVNGTSSGLDAGGSRGVGSNSGIVSGDSQSSTPRPGQGGQNSSGESSGGLYNGNSARRYGNRASNDLNKSIH